MKPGVYLGNVITRPRQGLATVLVLNTNESEEEVSLADLPNGDLSDYELLTLDSELDQIKGRILKLQNLLGLLHCNSEEEASIRTICREYNDLFYFNGDYLSCTDAATHRIQTETDKPPIYTKPYGLPDACRSEINLQIKDMLDFDIIRPSRSPWNTPC